MIPPRAGVATRPDAGLLAPRRGARHTALVLTPLTGLCCYIYFGQHFRTEGPEVGDTVGQAGCYSLWVQTDGITMLERGDERWQLQPGDVLLAEPGVVARWQAPARVTRLIFDLVPRERQPHAKGGPQPPDWAPQPDWAALFGVALEPRIPDPWTRRAKELVARGAMTNRQRRPAEWLEVCQHLGLWVAEYAASQAAPEGSEPRCSDPIVAAAEALFSRRFDPKPTVEAVAAELGVSRGHLSRLFKQVRGYGPGHARLLLQIENAKGLLRQGRSLQQTACLSGFNSLTGFREAFTRLVGVSPKRWQREHR